MSGVLISTDCTIAQIKPDATLGTGRSVVTPQSGGVDLISGGAKRGANLFHSFERFSVHTGRTAFFNNSPNIQNIINRVTGGSVSNIDGLLRAEGSANLFLLNPNGIVFGPNATLSIGGSFLASTADSLTFADGTMFRVTAPQTKSLLTVSVPIGLQFGGNPGRILVQGDGNGIRQTLDLIDTTAGLRVQPNQTLALVGGDVALEGGTLKTAGGKIELGSVASLSLVSLTPTGNGWSLGYEGVQNFRDIQLAQQAAVDASGKGGGDIQMRGRQVTLTDGSQIEASTLGSQAGGTLAVTGSEFVKLISTSARFITSLGAQVYPGATGTGSNVTVKTGQLIVQDGAAVTTGTFGQGSAGSLTVSAQDSVELIGLSADGRNTSGLFAAALPGASAAAGKLTVETKRLIMRDGGQIFSGAFAKGSAGSIVISAEDSVELIGTGLSSPGSPTSTRDTSIGTAVHPEATGPGGNLSLETRRLLVQDGAEISTAAFGEGQGGNLSVRAEDSVKLSGTSANGTPSTLSARATGGNAGNLAIETRQLTVQDGAQVTVRNDGTGDAGILAINSNSISLMTRGGITALTQSGDGGNIQLDVKDLALLRDSSISASAGGIGAGGNVTINSDLLAALEDSDIIANAFQGQGGNIQINTQGFFRSPDSDITAQSQRGPQFNGTVEINTPDLDFAKASAVPTAAPESPQVGSACQGSSSAGRSQFTNTGTGGIPASPTDPLTNNPGWEDNASPASSSQAEPVAPPATNPVKFVEAQGWKRNPDGTMSMTTTPEEVIHYSSLSTPPCQN